MFLFITFKYVLFLFILLMIFSFMTLLALKGQLKLITFVFPLCVVLFFGVLVFMQCNFIFTTELLLVTFKRCIL